MAERNLQSLRNIREFHKKLNNFRMNGKYCDVTVIVQDQSFPCHRLALTMASEYFDTMFGGSFEESTAGTIHLQETEASTFEQVLRFVYTGDVVFTSENVFSLLRAGEYYKLKGLEKLSVSFIEQNLPVPDMFGTLTYSTLTQRSPLLRVLSRYIVAHFDEYADDPAILQLSFDSLNTLLSQRWYLARKHEGLFVDAIIRWMNYARDSREAHFEELIEKVGLLQNLSDEYVKWVLRRCTLRTLSDDGTDHHPLQPFEHANLPIAPALTLHLYVAGDDAKVRVYSAHKTTSRWSLAHTMDYTINADALALVGLNKYLYCLDAYVFRACISANVSPHCTNPYMVLKYPPGRLRGARMCALQNYIYAYTPLALERRSQDFGDDSSFSRAQLDQGICAYNTQLDKWFPLPPLRTKVFDSSITADDRVVYYVAGIKEERSFENRITIQSLDVRTPAWQDLSSSHAIPRRSNIGLLCSLYDRRIYVCSKYVFQDCQVITSYDLRAGRWAAVEPMNAIHDQVHDFVHYENLLWVFSWSQDENCRKMSAYNATLGEWKNSLISGGGFGIGSREPRGKLIQVLPFAV